MVAPPSSRETSYRLRPDIVVDGGGVHGPVRVDQAGQAGQQVPAQGRAGRDFQVPLGAAAVAEGGRSVTFAGIRRPWRHRRRPAS